MNSLSIVALFGGPTVLMIAHAVSIYLFVEFSSILFHLQTYKSVLRSMEVASTVARREAEEDFDALVSTDTC